MIQWLKTLDWGSVPDWLGFALAVLLAVLGFLNRDRIGAWVGRSLHQDSASTDLPQFAEWEISETDPEWGGEPYRDAVWNITGSSRTGFRVTNGSDWRARHVHFEPESPDIVVDQPVPETLASGESFDFRIDGAINGYGVKRAYLRFQTPDGGIVTKRFDLN